MKLSSDLISQFVKATKDTTTEKKTETTVYGTVVAKEGSDRYVRFDGASEDTHIDYKNIESTVEADVGDRVIVRIKNHTATIIGNTNPENRSVGKTTATNIASSTADTVANNVFNTLIADYAKVSELRAEAARIDLLEADVVKVNNTLIADYVKTETLEAELAKLDNVYAKTATVEELYAKKADIKNLESDIANIDTLIFGSATGTTIQTEFSNAVIAQLGDAQIKSAMIESISAGKITSGDIITNNVRVMSEDGKMLISDETIQISDDTRVRVQIGKDASNDYSINIWDQNGNLMFSEGGITDKAIKDAIIRDDMVSENANIHASKLDIDSLFSEINGSTNTIKSTQIKLDDKNQTLDVAFKSLENTITDQGETISSQGTTISTIQGQIKSKIWQQDINTAKNEMSTQYSTLEQNLGSFRTTVGETYATKDELDSIEIGGRNLLLNTGNNGQVKFTNNASSTTSAAIKTYSNNQGHVTLTASTDTMEVYYRFMVPKLTALYGLEHGKSYTFSGKAKTVTSSGTLTQLIVRTQHSTGSGWTGGVSHVITTKDTDDWVSFDKTFTIPETATGYYVSLQLYYEGAWTGTIELKDLKVEKGTEATDWSPAPEDFDAEIGSLNTRVSSAETSITQLTDKITANVTETNDLGTRMSTVEQTADGLTARLDGVQIGGRNLIANTSQDEIVLGEYPASGYSEGFSSKTINVPSKNEYVLSFDAKSTVSGDRIRCHFYDPNTATKVTTSTGYSGQSTDGVATVTLTDSWKRYWVKYNQLNTDSVTTTKTLLVGRRLAGLGTGSISIRAVKFEEGNQPTDWSPAPEDVDSDILNSAKTATNYLNFSSGGLIIGDLTKSTLGKNVLIDSDSVDIRNGDTALASFGADYLYLAKNSRNATIDLCNGLAKLYHQSRLSYDTLFVIETPNATEIRGTSDPLCVTSTVASKPAIKFANADGVLGSIGMVASGTESYITRNHPSTTATYSILDTGNYYKLMDSGWFNGGVLGDNFTVYNDNSQVKYRKIGKQVQIMGTVKPRVDIEGSTTQHTIFTLPSGYRPPYALHQVCYGSNNYTWRLTVNTNGTVCFSRYGLDSGYVTAAVGHWINFQATFFVD